MLKIAVQKSGRLLDDSMELLTSCGIKIDNGKNQLMATASNFPIQILYLRNSDIPEYVEDGVADLGIVGENLLEELEKNVKIVHHLGFAKCRLSLAVPKGLEYKDISFFEGKKIATSYPNTLKKYLKKNNITADIHEISGSVEIAPSIGLADGVCDLVSSGNTLFMNGLKEVEPILQSAAVIISHPKMNAEKQAILEKLIFRIKATQLAKKNKYIVLNIPNDKLQAACAILPGMKSPTVLPLEKKGWSAIQSVIPESDFWQSIDQLKAIGAEGILVIPIEKMVL